MCAYRLVLISDPFGNEEPLNRCIHSCVPIDLCQLATPLDPHGSSLSVPGNVLTLLLCTQSRNLAKFE